MRRLLHAALICPPTPPATQNTNRRNAPTEARAARLADSTDHLIMAALQITGALRHLASRRPAITALLRRAGRTRTARQHQQAQHLGNVAHQHAARAQQLAYDAERILWFSPPDTHASAAALLDQADRHHREAQTHLKHLLQLDRALRSRP